MSAAPRVGVAGLGLIGGSLLQGLGEGVGYDIDAGAARAAGFAVAGSLGELASRCELVIVCVPPAATAPVVRELLAADESVLVADAASVKAPVMAAVGERERFVGAHPLAGAPATGWAAADPSLLRDAVWAICPPALDAPAAALCALSAALAPLGARLVVCEAEAHDAAVARSSHVPHVVAQALAPATPLAAALSGGALRDMTRTATADEDLWLDILRSNRAANVAGLHSLGARLAGVADALEADDVAALRAAWRGGAAGRERLGDLRWGEPRWEPRRFDWPAWEELLALGAHGLAVRNVRAVGEAVELEAAVA